MAPAQRRKAYESDVTYVTNSELGFDYLRDHLAMSEAEAVLRPALSYCVIDEADSVLIDEARVPLIISDRTEAPVDKYQAAAKLAAALSERQHYTVAEKQMTVSLTEDGVAYCLAALQVADLYDPKEPWAAYVFAGHGVQLSAYAPPEKVPAGHALHVSGDDAPMYDEK